MKDLDAEIAYQAKKAGAVGELRPFSAAALAELRETPDWRTDPRQCIFRLLREAAPETVCDIGCGSGEDTVAMAALGYRVTGVELSPDLLALAHRRAELQGVSVAWHEGPGERTGLPSGGFDLVHVGAAFHHMDIPATAAEAARLLKPGGTLLMREPVLLPAVLRRIRQALPDHRNLSVNEESLGDEHLAMIEVRFDLVESNLFRGFTRLGRLAPGRLPGLRRRWQRFLTRLDARILRHPLLRRTAGMVVNRYRKKADA